MRKSTQNNRKSSSNNKLENMKYEIANELGVNLGGETTAKENGRVGGEMTRRFVEMGQGKNSQSRKSTTSKSKSKNN
jgi:hypothetical protein